MDEFKWIQISFILVTVLQLTAGTGLSPLQDYVIVGDDVALACGNVIEDQSDCDSTTWTYSGPSNAAVELITLGQIAENTTFESDRLSVTVNCSLVIKKVTKEDAGYFRCQQYKSDRKVNPDAPVYLSVISMTEQRNGDEATLICSVSTSKEHRVKWLFQGKNVKEHQNARTSYSPCNASVTFPIHHYMYKSRYRSLECKVSVGHRGYLFSFRLQASAENLVSGVYAGTNQTEPTTTVPKATDAVRAAQWRLIVVSVGLSALIITVVMVNVWTRTKGKQTRMDENVVNGSHEDDDAVNYENIRSPAEE
ncbi:uncharacterized protein LOC132984643 isoform X1 [Labrus mixtus]|uniref:uncharacterized protein LOC132984643 isoform X1 n=1 Tax=Labrus mixtus TaxID=508554 RepID=UPI0029BFE045|nr:uncharacterized protein LOC132984643 isoform X1 [Labrus mixtus]